jgi:hypothetical protein
MVGQAQLVYAGTRTGCFSRVTLFSLRRGHKILEQNIASNHRTQNEYYEFKEQ